jgi:hypothetical protein
MFLSTGPALLVDVPREKNITGKWTSLFVTFLFLVIASLHVNENFFWGCGVGKMLFQNFSTCYSIFFWQLLHMLCI